jgi:hypothetical protein
LSSTSRRLVTLSALAASSVLLAACGGGGEDAQANGTPANQPTNVPVNSAPQISGTPATSVVAGHAYSFAPTASDADGDPLTYSVTNAPAWATFNAGTGALSGTPPAAGSFAAVVISVTDGKATTSLPAFSITVTAAPPPPPANRAPTISGTPATSVLQGQLYAFTPIAVDADGDPLTFSINAAKPAWASFSGSTGALTGTPGAGDVGTYSNIQISVSDGKATTSLAAFSVQVVAIASGSATLTWQPPTTNTDGSQLANLAGYKIYWGKTQGNFTNSVTLTNPGLTSYVVAQLTAGTWYFAATAVNAQGIESVYSNVASKTL